MSDERKIVGLDGKPVEPPAPKASSEVVSLLESLLDRARRGEIDGVAVCYTTPESGDQHLFQSCWCGPRITLLGTMARQMYALNRELDNNDGGHVFR